MIEFPELETSRLWLCALEQSDAPEILRLRSEPGMLRFIEMYRLNSLEEASEMIAANRKKFLAGKGLMWGIRFRNEQRIIGYLGYHTIIPEHFRAEVCYLLLPDYRKQGIMAEAMESITSHAFNVMNLNRLEALIMKGNTRSIRVALKAGYRKEGSFRQQVYFNGRFIDYLVYAMIRADFNNSAKK